MDEPKRGIARIEVPKRKPVPGAVTPPGPVTGSTSGQSTRHRLMAQAGGNRRDPWLAPLAGLLLAFSVVSLIIQLLIAFS